MNKKICFNLLGAWHGRPPQKNSQNELQYRKKPKNEKQSEKQLSEEDLQYEMELAEEIGDFLDELIEKEEVPPAPKKQLDL